MTASPVSTALPPSRAPLSPSRALRELSRLDASDFQAASMLLHRLGGMESVPEPDLFDELLAGVVSVFWPTWVQGGPNPCPVLACLVSSHRWRACAPEYGGVLGPVSSQFCQALVAAPLLPSPVCESRAWVSFAPNLRHLWYPDESGCFDRRVASAGAVRGVPLAVAATVLAARADGHGSGRRYYASLPGLEHQDLLDVLTAQMLGLSFGTLRLAGACAESWRGDPRMFVPSLLDALN